VDLIEICCKYNYLVSKWDGRRIDFNAKRLTFEDASNYSEFGIIGRNQIKTYLREAYKAFESTELLPKAKQLQALKA